ncbi:M23 family metallopeptidase [Pseudodesulfovibrio sp.]|uniref:M23 family metallopeptidase n=1 Tax=unclassified Pseudodesulfovibrio TaxID=2661612 RepID=UPI003B006E13
MKRLLLLVMLVAALTLPLTPVSGTAQDFGLQDGDGAALGLPGEAQAAKAGQAPAESGTALVLAAPSRIGVGQPFLVRLTSDRPMDSVAIHWEGKVVVPSISVWNNRHVALAMLGTDVLSAKPGKEDLSVIASIDGKENTLRRTVQLTGVDYPKQELTLPTKMVTPPTKVYDRIKEDRAAVHKALATNSAVRMWRLPLERPVDGRITSLYGLRRILNGKPKNPHRGLDFSSPMGNPVKSVADGIVILTGSHYYAGNSVYIDHGNGVVSMYFHLSKILVKEGDHVARGQVFALSGKSGRATGPHLHLSVAVLGKLVDPQPLIESDTDTLLHVR